MKAKLQKNEQGNIKDIVGKPGPTVTLSTATPNPEDWASKIAFITSYKGSFYNQLLLFNLTLESLLLIELVLNSST
jgi:hypothetical protein